MHRSGEDGWIESSAQQTRGKAKKALATSPGNHHHLNANGQQAPSGSAMEAAHAKARQRLLQEQLRRKAVGTAFSSSNGGQGQGQGPSAGIKSVLKTSTSSSSSSRAAGPGTAPNNHHTANKASSSSSTSLPAAAGSGFKDHHATPSSPIESPCTSAQRPVLGGVAGAWAGVVAGGTGGGPHGSNPHLASPSPTSVINIDGVVASPSNPHRSNSGGAATSAKGTSYVASTSNGMSNGQANGASGGVSGPGTNRSATSFLKNLLFSRGTPAPAITTTGTGPGTGTVASPTSGKNKKRREQPHGAGASTSATGTNRSGDNERNAVAYPAEFPDLPGRVSGTGGTGGAPTSSTAIDNHPPGPGPPVPVVSNGRLQHSLSESSSQMTHHSTLTDIEDQSRYSIVSSTYTIQPRDISLIALASTQRISTPTNICPH